MCLCRGAQKYLVPDLIRCIDSKAVPTRIRAAGTTWYMISSQSRTRNRNRSGQAGTETGNTQLKPNPTRPEKQNP